MDIKECILSGRASLGIELGSTRIKAVLIGGDFSPAASGSYEWENRFENGIWTYRLEDAVSGVQAAYAALAEEVRGKYGIELERLASIGVSAMMHGYLPLDKNDELLTPFRTWRNTFAEKAAAELTESFGFNIPCRWSIAHLYHAISNGENHCSDIAYLTTLAGYIHYLLTGVKAVGAGEASGMFPIDGEKLCYNEEYLGKFDRIAAEKGFDIPVRSILPDILPAGENAGYLTEKGARLLDPSGKLCAGIPFCPPEGDAGTGMTATNSVAAGTGNVSAGTSVFAMIILGKPLEGYYPEIDIVASPDGKPAAMVHCNSCTNEINAWAQLFKGFLNSMGIERSMGDIYSAIFGEALKGEKDCGGLLLYNFLSGEPAVGLDEGRPLLVRTPDAGLDFANLARVQLYSAVSALKIGMEILKKENVSAEMLMGHGGYFKSSDAGQRILAAALDTPVSVMKTAGEGGPWGMALLAAYLVRKEKGETLDSFLRNKVFAESSPSVIYPDPDDRAGFDSYMEGYRKGLAVERCAVENIR